MKKLNSIEKKVAGVFMLLIILAGFTQVIFRYVLKLPLAWTDDVVIFCHIWCVFLGASVATAEKKHIRITMLTERLPLKVQFFIDILSDLLWIVACILLTYTGYLATSSHLKTGAKTLSSGLPYWLGSIILPICFVIMGIKVALQIKDTIKNRGAYFNPTRGKIEEGEH